MDIINDLLSGNIDAVNRMMADVERGNQEAFVDGFRRAMVSELRPAIVWWLQNGGTHEPSCGSSKGDLLRWLDTTIGGKLVRVPTVRCDILQQIVDGKVEVRGTELIRWIATKLDSNTRNVFVSVRRGQNKETP